MTPRATPQPPVDPDAELRERFHALRAEAAHLAPGFQATWAALPEARARAARRRWSMGLALAVGVAGLALLALGLWPRRERMALVDLGVTRWEGPTDFLLRTPAMELWRTPLTFTTDGRLLP